MEDLDVQAAKEDRRYMSRKFRLSVAAWVVGTIGWAAGFFMETQLFTTDQWVLFTQWIVGIYMVGNVGDSFAEGLAGVFGTRQ